MTAVDDPLDVRGSEGVGVADALVMPFSLPARTLDMVRGDVHLARHNSVGESSP